MKESKELICKMCRLFYAKGWVSGTGGGMTIRLDNDLALIAPSGIQKEEIQPEDLFLIKLDNSENTNYKIIEKPDNLNISACTSIFVQIFKQRPAAKAIIHSHSINAVMLTKITQYTEILLEKYEMLKGLQGGTYFGSHILPILDNVEHECDLAEAVGKAVKQYPLAHAVLVRDHGVYIWGDSPEKAKIHAECYDYLFEALLQEKTLKALNLIKG